MEGTAGCTAPPPRAIKPRRYRRVYSPTAARKQSPIEDAGSQAGHFRVQYFTFDISRYLIKFTRSVLIPSKCRCHPPTIASVPSLGKDRPVCHVVSSLIFPIHDATQLRSQR